MCPGLQPRALHDHPAEAMSPFLLHTAGGRGAQAPSPPHRTAPQLQGERADVRRSQCVPAMLGAGAMLLKERP